MEAEKPKDISEYKAWLKKTCNVHPTSTAKTYYDAVTNKVLADFRKSDFWQSLQSDLSEINRGYYVQTNYYLLTNTEPPSLLAKPYESFLLKTFRFNVLSNPKWPEPPDAGWCLPENWWSQIHDVIRTCFVVKYLDGVQFFAEELAKRAHVASYKPRVDFEAKEEGYYAAHFYVSFPCEIPCEDWDTRDANMPIEIQITTQLQEVIRRMLHNYYEQRRATQCDPGQKWQWDYRSDEFAANYLGHILHYVEGMIVDVRDNRIGKGTGHEG